ncbi:hypothetical protein [Catenulispora pinisilvae]|uniref:hypothetical protein n=1 Tax=Catenulispora pinisilvae TaxID=2705253 RepID=UPI00189137A9|nr:hypothetical protein [Catenulispora pinisilvae]
MTVWGWARISPLTKYQYRLTPPLILMGLALCWYPALVVSYNEPAWQMVFELIFLVPLAILLRAIGPASTQTKSTYVSAAYGAVAALSFWPK